MNLGIHPDSLELFSKGRVGEMQGGWVPLAQRKHTVFPWAAHEAGGRSRGGTEGILPQRHSGSYRGQL